MTTKPIEFRDAKGPDRICRVCGCCGQRVVEVVVEGLVVWTRCDDEDGCAENRRLTAMAEQHETLA